jgi:metalloendopeptidase OMA1, mitochondrial
MYGERGRGAKRTALWRILPIVVVGLIILFKFLGAEKTVNPVTGKKHRVALSARDEAVLGLQSFQAVLAQSDLVTSGPEVEQVRAVARRLAAATGSDATNYQWEVRVIRSSMANAFCLPGGKIAVYTGILPYTQTEAGLAAVMGHEMAHATARHAAQRLFQQNLVQTAMMGAALSVSDMEPQQQRAVLGALGAGAQVGVILPFSRDHETEADEMGILYMARAGYDPRESIRFWERMAEAGGQQPPEFMSTHPSHGSRVERLQRIMPKALAEYEKAPNRNATGRQ